MPDAPARVVGTSNLSDGNVLAHPTEAVREGRSRRKHRETGKKALSWPWDRPATVVHSDPGAPPGHHAKSYMSDNRGHGPNAVKLSEKAAAILQGFPEGWLFSGETKKARWAQIGMAMPPPLAAAVAESIRAWFDKREHRSREATAMLNGGL